MTTTAAQATSKWNAFATVNVEKQQASIADAKTAKADRQEDEFWEKFQKFSMYGSKDTGRDEEDEEPLFPLRFYRSDGKLFHLRYDLDNCRNVDHDWNDNVVYFDPSQAEIFASDGRLPRPTYTTTRHQTAKEVNYGRWKLVEPKQSYEWLQNNTWCIESWLNNYDFNMHNEVKVRLRPLNNRVGVPLQTIYPRGKELLITESLRADGPEWKVGQPLGPDPTNEENRKTHLGWVPPRYRAKGCGLGADPTDPVQKHWFFGDLDAPAPSDHPDPPLPWSMDKTRQLRMKSDKGNEFVVLSFSELKKRHRQTPQADSLEIQPES
ncbi:hypothetical protein F4677DRAFT_250036 [Hypoxylon crocopeplum]|nr:hypothetical protein F4677DRAFT_250036 [Hypoxylon crocopeplum]